MSHKEALQARREHTAYAEQVHPGVKDVQMEIARNPKSLSAADNEAALKLLLLPAGTKCGGGPTSRRSMRI